MVVTDFTRPLRKRYKHDILQNLCSRVLACSKKIAALSTGIPKLYRRQFAKTLSDIVVEHETIYDINTNCLLFRGESKQKTRVARKTIKTNCCTLTDTGRAWISRTARTGSTPSVRSAQRRCRARRATCGSSSRTTSTESHSRAQVTTLYHTYCA